MIRRPAVLLALATLSLSACAGVGGSSGGAQNTAGAAYSGAVEGPLNIMGFSGEDEVATARIAAFQASAPKV